MNDVRTPLEEVEITAYILDFSGSTKTLELAGV